MGSPVSIREGVRFGCTKCGNCCLKPGFVYLNLSELEQMAAVMKLSVSEFRLEFEIDWDAPSSSYILEAKDKGCPLLDEAMGCRVHTAKPSQCRTFPFWNELLTDQGEWEEAKKDCPGIDHPEGRIYEYSEIVSLRQGSGRT